MACDNLSNNLELLNSINVFPVPDQDTGSNMTLSMSKAYAEVQAAGDADTLTCVDILSGMANGLLHHGKGNSGTILTLFFQGLADTIAAGEGSDEVDAHTLAKGFINGAANAFAGVANPMDGTILTIVQKAGEEGLEYCGQSATAVDTLSRMTTEAHAVLPLTSKLNPVLAEYSVIDSGALGFCMIMDGLEAACLGKDQVNKDYSFVKGIGKEIEVPELTFQFCTEFVIAKAENETPDILRRQLNDLGDCIVPVVSDDQIKMHIHTNKPDAVFFLASLCGPIKMTKVDNMLLQSKPKEKPVIVYLCTTELYRDGFLSMSLENVFMGDGKDEEFIETIEAHLAKERKVILLTSTFVTGPLVDRIPVVRFFPSDEELMNYIYTMER
ncbi:MAG: DAK2 domain-containing protein [Eubacterium sp.]|nr:DAK2 domain-containing protein [Candidatus Colimonas fimequi]